MCFPVVMERVRERMAAGPVDRRRLLGATGAAGAALALSGRRAGAGRTGETTIRYGEVVDLTHTLSAAFPLYPGYQEFSAVTTSTIDGIGSYAQVVSASEHNGTHMDAPAHFAAGGDTVDLIPAGRLVAPLAVIDIGDRAEANPDATLTVDDLLAWEEAHGELPAGAFVALLSGWAARADDPAAYLNIDASGTLHSPGWSAEAAAFLVEERDVTGVGTDTITLDAAADLSFPAHLTLLPAGIYGIENLANLDAMPASGATVVIGAPKHAGGSGGQTRVLALV